MDSEPDFDLNDVEIVQPIRRVRHGLSTYWHGDREVGLSYQRRNDDEKEIGVFHSTDRLVTSTSQMHHLGAEYSLDADELEHLLVLFRNAHARRIIAVDFAHAMKWIKAEQVFDRIPRPWWLDAGWEDDPLDRIMVETLLRMNNLTTSFDRYLIGTIPLISTADERVAIRAALLGKPVYDLTKEIVFD